MDDVARWVASLPGAIGHVRAFGTGPLLLGTAAILLLCLLRTRLRWSGAALRAVTTPRPDVLLSGVRRWAAGGAHQRARQLRPQGMACRR